jgi:hypothetical protein
MFPDVTAEILIEKHKMQERADPRAHHVSQFIQIRWSEVPIVAVTTLHVFVDAMQVQSYAVE